MHYHEYFLVAQGQLNAKSEIFRRPGALIMNDEGGFGCIHPWPELGDATLEKELDAIRRGDPLSLGKRALECAKVDAKARAEGISLFHDLRIPESHATLPPSISPSTVRIMANHGFRAGKIKALANIDSTRERLTTLAAMAPHWRWRLDFNAVLTVNEAAGFWKSLPGELKQKIDFIEDPCNFTQESWQQLTMEGLPIACDLGSDICHQPKITIDIPMVRVIKPARERSPKLRTGSHVFTSVMDHPIGQLWAAYCAAYYYNDTPQNEVPLCGLCTHLLFKKDAFIEALGDISPTINVPEGTGLGFDDLLTGLEWKKLK